MKQKTASRKIKILVAKLGLDGHDRGALVLCRGFRDDFVEMNFPPCIIWDSFMVSSAASSLIELVGFGKLSVIISSPLNLKLWNNGSNIIS